MSGHEDTIAAIATAQGGAGIAIIRISGPRSWEVGAKVAGVPVWPREAAGTFRRATFHAVTAEGKTVVMDDGIVLLFAAPRSYTGEDVVELQCHGGRLQARQVLEAVLSAGARPAEPGEFTRRAFLAGRIDLARAEAVMDFISARTERAAAAARMQMEGRLSRTVDALFDGLVEVHSNIEHLLDFDEGEVPEDFTAEAAAALVRLRDGLAALEATWHEGHLLREGALVVISGRPNAGKSSLMNALLGRDRAIVSPTPGTTRDSIEESFEADGIPVRLVDTAGLRDAPSGDIEAEGIARTERLVRDADIVMRVIDASKTIDEEENEEVAALPRDRTLVVLNKTDVATPDVVMAAETLFNGLSFPVCRVSAKTGDNMDGLARAIGGMLCSTATADTPGVSSRHRREVAQALAAVDEARSRLADGSEGLVLAAECLRTAADALGRITGRVWSEELLDNIFGRFCVGK